MKKVYHLQRLFWIPSMPSFASNHVVPIGRQRLVKNRKEKNIVVTRSTVLSDAGWVGNSEVLVLRERQASDWRFFAQTETSGRLAFFVEDHQIAGVGAFLGTKSEQFRGPSEQRQRPCYVHFSIRVWHQKLRKKTSLLIYMLNLLVHIYRKMIGVNLKSKMKDLGRFMCHRTYVSLINTRWHKLLRQRKMKELSPHCLPQFTWWRKENQITKLNISVENSYDRL